MFICEKCGESSAPGERAEHEVVEKRPRSYDLGGERMSWGWEIVKEILVHSYCKVFNQ